MSPKTILLWKKSQKSPPPPSSGHLLSFASTHVRGFLFPSIPSGWLYHHCCYLVLISRTQPEDFSVRVHPLLQKCSSPSVWRERRSLWTVDKHEQWSSGQWVAHWLKARCVTLLPALCAVSWQAEHDEERQQRVGLSVRADSGLRLQAKRIFIIYETLLSSAQPIMKFSSKVNLLN